MQVIKDIFFSRNIVFFIRHSNVGSFLLLGKWVIKKNFTFKRKIYYFSTIAFNNKYEHKLKYSLWFSAVLAVSES